MWLDRPIAWRPFCKDDIIATFGKKADDSRFEGAFTGEWMSGLIVVVQKIR